MHDKEIMQDQNHFRRTVHRKIIYFQESFRIHGDVSIQDIAVER